MQQGEPAMLNSQPRSPLGQCISDDIMVSEREREGERERWREGEREEGRERHEWILAKVLSDNNNNTYSMNIPISHSTIGTHRFHGNGAYLIFR